jgi:uncharacterized protein
MKLKKLKDARQEKKGTYLWEVKGGNAKMYLLGTVHIVPKNFFPLKDEIVNRFDECRNLVLEVLLDEIDTVPITNDIINNKEYTYEDGDSLYNHFPKEKVINLKNYLVKNKLCSKEIAKKFYKLTPDAVMALIHDGRLKKSGINQEHIGIDYFFMKRAKELNKNMLELETAEFQQEVLDKYYGKNHTVSSTDTDNNPSQLESLPILDEGRLGRFKKLKMHPFMFGLSIKIAGILYEHEAIIEKERKLLVSKNVPLVGNRDEEMCKKIEGLLKTDDSYFVAVGTLHLIGEGSITDRLQKKGYEVIRIC